MPEAGTVLAFDFGTRWIGVAVGDRALGSAHPLARIDATDRDASAASIAAWSWAPRRTGKAPSAERSRPTTGLEKSSAAAMKLTGLSIRQARKKWSR